MNSLYAGLSDIGMSVATAKTEFFVFGYHHPPDSKIQVDPDSIFATASLKYLGLEFGTSVQATRSLTINVLRRRLMRREVTRMKEKSYGLFSKAKGYFQVLKKLGRVGSNQIL